VPVGPGGRVASKSRGGADCESLSRHRRFLACAILGMVDAFEPSAPISGSAYDLAIALPRTLPRRCGCCRESKPLVDLFGDASVLAIRSQGRPVRDLLRRSSAPGSASICLLTSDVRSGTFKLQPTFIHTHLVKRSWPCPRRAGCDIKENTTKGDCLMFCFVVRRFWSLGWRIVGERLRWRQVRHRGVRYSRSIPAPENPRPLPTRERCEPVHLADYSRRMRLSDFEKQTGIKVHVFLLHTMKTLETNCFAGP